MHKSSLAYSFLYSIIWLRLNRDVFAFSLEDAGTIGIYKLFWNYLNSCEFDDLPLFLVSEEGVSKRLHEN